MIPLHLRLRIALLAGLLLPGALDAHEFWIDAGPDLTADLRVGQDFSGAALPYLDRTIRSMRHVAPDSTVEVAARLGDIPAIAGLSPAKDGLHALTVETQPAYVVFDSLTDFEDYLAYEGLASVVDLHRDRGLPEDDIAEQYIRNARALVQVGPVGPEDRDRATGLPLELVIAGTPFGAADDPLDVRLTWQGAAVEGTQVALFHLPDGGTAPADTTRTLATTDETGTVRFARQGPGRYLLNAVRMEPADGPGSVVWQSHWASLTFDLPDAR